ncbi:MAG: hypothetical protein LWY06_10825 [Firmicutes bacterium]|nr:hypothetical protein [Bacillota bacterium]
MNSQGKAMVCLACRKKLSEEDSYYVVDDDHYCWKCGFAKMTNDFNTKFESRVFIHSGKKKLPEKTLVQKTLVCRK